MKLFYTSNSPYARIARVAVLELNISHLIEMQKVTVGDPNSEILHYKPTGKIPTLAIDNGFMTIPLKLINSLLNMQNSTYFKYFLKLKNN
ncbi:glutathione S-transferase N-terminal domain-containing protein [Anabaena lutea]|uniref:Glutathione S-transferase N-terminal domain-containing protein n=1 Tax=Anabaena lutea FACHB-196 TaxID=2692881 RepID=A0ABR8FJZ9_9NOST|nr:glutathione S-transferase N-terminal domain-containing protein [Anabaena lutea]MBD2570111.1 glutathione S-transferase N-terminal domain-containing protein [Anabaena lutea FACHB-196]